MLSTHTRLIRRLFSSSRVVQDGIKVGFIGLGNMGQGMAKNLIEKGHDVVAFDTSAEALKVAVANGATEGSSPKDVASQCSKMVCNYTIIFKHIFLEMEKHDLIMIMNRNRNILIKLFLNIAHASEDCTPQKLDIQYILSLLTNYN